MDQNIKTFLIIGIGFLAVVHSVVPLKMFFLVSAVTTVIGAISYVIYNGWESSLANEWLLLIQNGELKKAGVGLKTFKSYNQISARFSNEIRKIEFKAEQVTKEMQGLSVSGFAVWGVNRTDEGPYKCFKYMQGGSPDENVKTLCESVVRFCIANTKMTDVITNRQKLRDQMKEDIKVQVTGWGAWVETIEITEVQISSANLFKNLQAEFRNKKKLIAEKCRQENQKAISQQTAALELEVNEKLQQFETKKQENSSKQKLEREQLKTKFFTEKIEIEKLMGQYANELQLAQLEKETKIQQQKQANEITLKKITDDHNSQMNQRKLDCESLMTEKNMQLYQQNEMTNFIKGTLYAKLNCVNQTNYIGDEALTGMPLLAMLTQQNQEQRQNL